MARNHDEPSAVGEPPERRRSERHVALFPATFETIFGDRQFCLSHDVSSRGGLFLTTEEYEPGERLAVELHIGGPYAEQRSTPARVVRVRVHGPDTVWLYDTAVEFERPSTDLDSEAKSLSARQRRLGLLQRNKSDKDG